MRGFFRRLGRAVAAFVRVLPGYFRRDFIWWLVLLPLPYVALVYFLSDANFLHWRDTRAAKELMEVVHPSLLAGGVAVAAAGWVAFRDKALALVAGVVAVCLGRELGGQGTSPFMVAGLLACILYWHAHREELGSFTRSRWPRSLFAVGWICYAGSQALDRGIVNRIGRLVTGDGNWRPLYSSNIEECLEVFGGFFLLLSTAGLVVAVLRARSAGKRAEP